jgi:hypothetical protein
VKPLEIKIFREINHRVEVKKNAMAFAKTKKEATYFKSDLDKNKAEINN